MSQAISTDTTQLERAMDILLDPGRAVFSFAIIALGIETFLCAHSAMFLDSRRSNPRFKVIPILPFLPAIPWLAYIFGNVLAACGVGLLFKRSLRMAAVLLGSLLVLCTLVLEVPKYAAIPGNMSLRTVVFEPLAIGVLAWLLPGRDATSSLLARVSRYLLAVSFIVFGVDHFLALAPIGTLYRIGFHGTGSGSRFSAPDLSLPA